MAPFRYAVIAAFTAAAAQADGSMSLKHYPEHFCKKFDVSGIPIKLRITIKSEAAADVEATLEGFTVDCMNEKFKFHADGEIEMLASKDADGVSKNCVREQFEGLGANFEDFKIEYDSKHDALNLYSSGIGKEVLTHAEECKDWKFETAEAMDDDFGSDDDSDWGTPVRRLFQAAFESISRVAREVAQEGPPAVMV
eukprot:TRINITY_DN146_c0_g2_i1.p1 TRINITY_DN146_c0_g2~~TRINITY_DN146_c0_g2_i1.p1  ORF type:complete len:228 (+),score=71.67 TRINITY_DN146_c0_g2_i1:97-684(+)